MPSYNYKHSREDVKRAKQLRKLAPKAEYRLWYALMEINKTTDLKFRRQHPIPPYTADFACVKARLVIELDGPSHETQQDYDIKREADLRKKGWMILRFTNEDVEKNRNGVVQTIIQAASLSLPARP